MRTAWGAGGTGVIRSSVIALRMIPEVSVAACAGCRSLWGGRILSRAGSWIDDPSNSQKSAFDTPTPPTDTFEQQMGAWCFAWDSAQELVKHQMRETMRLPALLGGAAAAVLLSIGAGAAETPPLVVFVSPNPVGVNDFLKLGKVGTEKAAKALGATAKIYESTDPTTRRQNVEAAAKEGAKVVVSVGFEFDDILPDVAAAYPSTKFLTVDSCPKPKSDNLYCAVFKEHEGIFLAGAEAALTSKTGKVGAIGALDIPFMHRFTDPFLAGARHIKPGIATATTLWIGGDNPFSDPARGQQRAAIMVSDNVDRVMAAGAGSNGGIFKAMEDLPGAAAFGVDVNQCRQAPGLVIDNVEKRTDTAIEKTVAGLLKGDQPKLAAFGLAEGGVALTSLQPGAEDSGCLIAKQPDVIEKLKALQGEIVSGALKVDDPMQKPR
jgi:basic membrane protein A and related proteins